VTQRKLNILRFVAAYYTLTSRQIAHLLGMTNMRLVRRILAQMVAEKLINRTRMEVVPPGGSTAPVYYPAVRGCEYLAEAMCDERYLSVTTRCPEWTKLYHWVQLTEFHIGLDEGLAGQEAVRVERWISEWEVCDQAARDPEDRFTLYTLLAKEPKRLVFNPDAGLLAAFDKVKLAVYVELDRASSSIRQIASSKTPAVPVVLAQKTHRKHFPNSTEETFRILHVTTSPARRDLLRAAIAPKKGSELHRFVAWAEWEEARRLWCPIFYTCDKGPAPLIPGPDQVGK
jgi:hypothetical protein